MNQEAFMEYFIYMTNDCNLHCEYCSVLLDCKKNNMPMQPSYSWEKLKNFVIKTQNEYQDKEANIYFFGGEPTLCYKQIMKLMEVIGTQIGDISIKYVLHTNGLLLNEIPNEIAQKLRLVMHSLNYEKFPKYNLEDSYFSEVMNGLFHFRMLSQAEVIARLTITEKTSVYTEVIQIAHFYDYVYWQIENCTEFNDFKTFYSTYTYEIKLLFDYWMKYLRLGILINLIPFMAILKFTFEHDRDDKEFSCGYGRGMIYVQTNGICFACSDDVDRQTHKIGTLDEGIVMPYPSLMDLKCGQCSYRYLCMGRCGRMHKEFSKTHIAQYCSLNQYMFNLFIENKSELQDIYNQYEDLRNKLKSPTLEYTEFTP